MPCSTNSGLLSCCLLALCPRIFGVTRECCPPPLAKPLRGRPCLTENWERLLASIVFSCQSMSTAACGLFFVCTAGICTGVNSLALSSVSTLLRRDHDLITRVRRFLLLNIHVNVSYIYIYTCVCVCIDVHMHAWVRADVWFVYNMLPIHVHTPRMATCLGFTPWVPSGFRGLFGGLLGFMMGIMLGCIYGSGPMG